MDSWIIMVAVVFTAVMVLTLSKQIVKINKQIKEAKASTVAEKVDEQLKGLNTWLNENIPTADNTLWNVSYEDLSPHIKFEIESLTSAQIKNEFMAAAFNYLAEEVRSI